MNTEWKKIRVGDVVTFQNGYAFKSKSFTTNGNYKLIRIKELKNGKIVFFNDTVTINDTKNEYDKYKINYGDVIFALTGDPVSRNNPLSWVGRVGIYLHKKTALLNQRLCKVIFSDKVNSLFFYYYFKNFDNFYTLAKKATGSANQANISTNTISDSIINLPNYETQRKIDYILNTIDTKIETNNQINNKISKLGKC